MPLDPNGGVDPDNPDDSDPEALFTFCEWLAESGNREYVISGCGQTGAWEDWCVYLQVDGRRILGHDWWDTGMKACGDRDIRTLSEAQDVAQDWETAIVAYEIWRTGLWETAGWRFS
jgi:hypothetical protein